MHPALIEMVREQRRIELLQSAERRSRVRASRGRWLSMARRRIGPHPPAEASVLRYERPTQSTPVTRKSSAA